jgi:hypothetical protein
MNISGTGRHTWIYAVELSQEFKAATNTHNKQRGDIAEAGYM